MKETFIREQLFYGKELIPFLAASVVMIGVGVVLGFLSPLHAPKVASQVSAPVAEFVNKFVDLPKPYLALAIFFNNVLKTLLVIVLGTLWGLVPVVFLAVNGYALGLVLYLSIKSRGVWVSLLAIAPHGLFELPGVLLGTSIGLMLGVRALKRMFRKTETTASGELKRALGFFFVVIVPLLLIAAFVEAFITTAGVSR